MIASLLSRTVLAQADTTLAGAVGTAGEIAPATLPDLVTPHVDWMSIAPVSFLIGGALLLVVIGSLARHTTWIRKVYVWFTCVTAIVAALFTIPLWDRVSHGRATPTIANAVNVDGFGVFVTVLICIAVVMAVLIADGYLTRESLQGPEFYALTLLSASGGVIMATANDLIVLFLGLEILSIALYILAGSQLRRAESQEAALKYFVLGGFSSAVFLYGVALTYGATGTTNLTEITTFLADNIILKNGLLTAGLALLLVGLCFKIAAVPFHMWTPDVYQGSPSPVTGFMAAAAKAAGFAGLLRVLMTAMMSRRLDWQPIIWVLAVVTMIVGSVLAAAQTDIKRMMAYSSISHAGFILIGVQAASNDGVAGALFYLLAYTFIVLGTFAIITVVGRRGDAAHSLDNYKGLSQRSPVLAITFTLFLLAQAGIPVTSGFTAKFGVIRAAVDSHSYAIAIIAMLTSVIGGYFYLKVIVQMYQRDPDADSAPVGSLVVPIGTRIVLVAAVGFTLFAGVIPQTLIDFAHKAVLK